MTSCDFNEPNQYTVHLTLVKDNVSVDSEIKCPDQVFLSGDPPCQLLQFESDVVQTVDSYTGQKKEGSEIEPSAIQDSNCPQLVGPCADGHSVSAFKQIICDYGEGREEKVFECKDCGEYFSKVSWSVNQYENQMYLMKQDRAKKLLIKAKLYQYADKPQRRIKGLYGITKKIKQQKKKQETVLEQNVKKHLDDLSASNRKAIGMKKSKNFISKTSKQKIQEEKIRSKPCPKSKKILQYREINDKIRSKPCPKSKKILPYREINDKSTKIKVKEHKMYSCPVCFVVFLDNALYKSHLATHTHCVHCDKVFKAYENLRRHLKTHCTDQDYLCNVCGKTFKAQQNLTKHKLIHREDYDCVCSICGKTFKAKPNLQKHMITHNKTLSFSCDICGKAFKAMQNLQKHSKIHLKKEVLLGTH